MNDFLILPENNNECIYFEDTEQKEFVDSLTGQFSNDSKKFKSFKEQFHRTGKAYVNFARKVQQLDIASRSNIELKQIYIDYQEKLIEYSCIGPWVGHLLAVYWTKRGNQILQNEDDKVKEALFRPSEKSTVLLMQEEAAKIQGQPEKIKQLWEKYRWLPCLDVHKVAWSLEDVMVYVKELKIRPTSEPLSFEAAAEKAKLTTEQKETFRMIKEIAYIKDARDDYRRQGIFYIQAFFAELAKRTNLSFKQVAYLTENEILEFLSGSSVNIELAKSRREHGFMMFQREGKMICIDKNIKRELEKIGFHQKEQRTEKIKGSCACKGKVRGKVVLVYTIHDILKVKKGDILVAVTTHPDYVPAMQKAAAIVTDEGGILSHAAIVARELGIPCIVGTGNATTVLDYGVEVEVDAEKGTVEII
ncbi:hypothetical protein HOA92_00885 [archaeon]|nr:hypothetical protein [archaeon]MBT6761573.1 hypothetical protein [archaeon]